MSTFTVQVSEEIDDEIIIEGGAMAVLLNSDALQPLTGTISVLRLGKRGWSSRVGDLGATLLSAEVYLLLCRRWRVQRGL